MAEGPKLRTTNGWAGSRYTNPSTGEVVPSVTTIISAGIPKPGLVNWAPKVAAEYAVANLAEISALVRRKDSKGAIDLIKGAPWRERDAAANIGTAVHSAIEAYVLDKPMPAWDEAITGHMGHFLDFLRTCTPDFTASEATVWSRRFGYAGTLDGIARIAGRDWLIDVKTNKPDARGRKLCWPEAALQMAAYRHADVVLMPDGSEYEMPVVDGCAVLHIRAEGWGFVPVQSDEEVFAAFLSAKEIYDWSQGLSKSVIGEPIYPAQTIEASLFPAKAVRA